MRKKLVSVESRMVWMFAWIVAAAWQLDGYSFAAFAVGVAIQAISDCLGWQSVYSELAAHYAIKKDGTCNS